MEVQPDYEVTQVSEQMSGALRRWARRRRDVRVKSWPLRNPLPNQSSLENRLQVGGDKTEGNWQQEGNRAAIIRSSRSERGRKHTRGEELGLDDFA
jgi:hypothetical protein